jgi:hypothetical protein
LRSPTPKVIANRSLKDVMQERSLWLDKKIDGVEYTLDMARHVMMGQPDIISQPKRIEEVANGV